MRGCLYGKYVRLCAQKGIFYAHHLLGDELTLVAKYEESAAHCFTRKRVSQGRGSSVNLHQTDGFVCRITEWQTIRPVNQVRSQTISCRVVVAIKRFRRKKGQGNYYGILGFRQAVRHGTLIPIFGCSIHLTPANEPCAGTVFVWLAPYTVRTTQGLREYRFIFIPLMQVCPSSVDGSGLENRRTLPRVPGVQISQLAPNLFKSPEVIRKERKLGQR